MGFPGSLAWVTPQALARSPTYPWPFGDGVTPSGFGLLFSPFGGMAPHPSQTGGMSRRLSTQVPRRLEASESLSGGEEVNIGPPRGAPGPRPSPPQGAKACHGMPRHAMPCLGMPWHALARLGIHMHTCGYMWTHICIKALRPGVAMPFF